MTQKTYKILFDSCLFENDYSLIEYHKWSYDHTEFVSSFEDNGNIAALLICVNFLPNLVDLDLIGGCFIFRNPNDSTRPRLIRSFESIIAPTGTNSQWMFVALLRSTSGVRKQDHLDIISVNDFGKFVDNCTIFFTFRQLHTCGTRNFSCDFRSVGPQIESFFGYIDNIRKQLYPFSAKFNFISSNFYTTKTIDSYRSFSGSCNTSVFAICPFFKGLNTLVNLGKLQDSYCLDGRNILPKIRFRYKQTIASSLPGLLLPHFWEHELKPNAVLMLPQNSTNLVDYKIVLDSDVAFEMVVYTLFSIN